MSTQVPPPQKGVQQLPLFGPCLLDGSSRVPTGPEKSCKVLKNEEWKVYVNCLCSRNLASSILDPVTHQPVFLRFDPVHSIKNVYNNFQDCKVFECPPMARNLPDFSHIVDLFQLESTMSLKKAHGLTPATLHPRSIENMSVKLAVCVLWVYLWCAAELRYTWGPTVLVCHRWLHHFAAETLERSECQDKNHGQTQTRPYNGSSQIFSGPKAGFSARVRQLPAGMGDVRQLQIKHRNISRIASHLSCTLWPCVISTGSSQFPVCATRSSAVWRHRVTLRLAVTVSGCQLLHLHATGAWSKKIRVLSLLKYFHLSLTDTDMMLSLSVHTALATSSADTIADSLADATSFTACPMSSSTSVEPLPDLLYAQQSVTAAETVSSTRIRCQLSNYVSH